MRHNLEPPNHKQKSASLSRTSVEIRFQSFYSDRAQTYPRTIAKETHLARNIVMSCSGFCHWANHHIGNFRSAGRVSSATTIAATSSG
jgi:hypothetical protein